MNKQLLLGKAKLGWLARSMIVIMAIVGIASFTTSADPSWGPSDRPTFTIDEPADYVTFNSITDNPDYGDERNFFDGKPASNTEAGGFTNNISVGDLSDGDEVLLRVYVHNNAADNLNESGEGIAENTRVRVDLPEGIDRSMRAQAYISADNAHPQTVFDSLDFQSVNRPFDLTYVEGSAMLYTNPHPEGRQISDDVVGTSGAQIGYDEINGEVPGCFEYSALVTIKVQVSKADVSIDKFVREVGDSDWSTDISVDPGAELEYLIEVENTGGTSLKNVAIGDNLPNYVAYVDGSTQYANASTSFEPRDLGSDNITTGGVDIGNYSPGSNAFVMFRADVDPVGAFDRCGEYVLRNVGIVRPFHDRELMNQFINTADITVNIECEAPEQPEDPERPDLPDELPRTGFSGVVGLFAATSALSAFAHRVFTARRGY